MSANTIPTQFLSRTTGVNPNTNTGTTAHMQEAKQEKTIQPTNKLSSRTSLKLETPSDISIP